ncbi:hypothetical protein [Acidovorax sp. 1608163]|uniref:hypothetical protein n=1 Tax=Acidovorax sp. 1608163 TaxID=2478662 RepID=UPI0013CF0205|nr:hypothetical protein [Acidovorax sp. 1608163]
MKLIYAALASAILTACGGGGSTGDTGVAPTTPAGGGEGGSNSSGIITFTDGDYYTFKIERVVTRNGIATSEPSTYYTYTIQNTQPNRAHQRIYTSWPYVKQLITYNSNNSITSTTAPYANCTYTEGLDNPTFDMQIGQQWDSTYSRKCDQGSQGSSVQYQYQHHSKGTISSKDPIKTEAGDFIAYKADRVREDTGSDTSTLKGSCWYDEKTSIVVMCDQTSYTTATSTLTTTNVESRSKITLIGINAKNHPVKKLTAATYFGSWELAFTDTDPGKCSIQITPDKKISGHCESKSTSFSVSGLINDDGGFEAAGTDGSKFQGKLSGSVSSSGTWFSTIYNNTSGTWTATRL